MDAEEINECDAGTHDCEENAECVSTSNSSYVCKCPTGKWGDDDIIAKGDGTKTTPCFWTTPLFQWVQMHPIKVWVQYTFFKFFKHFFRVIITLFTSLINMNQI